MIWLVLPLLIALASAGLASALSRRGGDVVAPRVDAEEASVPAFAAVPSATRVRRSLPGGELSKGAADLPFGARGDDARKRFSGDARVRALRFRPPLAVGREAGPWAPDASLDEGGAPSAQTTGIVALTPRR